LVRSLASSISHLPQGVVVEAFTPLPTGDLTVAEARAAWGDRPIWINYPSTVHLSPTDEVEEVTKEILQQATPGTGFLLGVTENMPAASWERSLHAIGRVISRYGRCPIEM
jgi:hypothetical protein